MKRFFSAIAFCTLLLCVLTFWLSEHSAAAPEDPIVTLLNLPAPPPPNPMVGSYGAIRDEKFYSKNSPPADNAPIEDLLDYWTRMSNGYQDLRFLPELSSIAADRIMREIEKEPAKISNFLNILPNDRRTEELAKRAYAALGDEGGDDSIETRRTLKKWLTYNTPEFSDELAQVAEKAGDSGEYVSNQDEILALTRVEWDRAAPMVNRLYNEPGAKAAKVLATWALYRHALESGSTDVDRYRDELKAFVENKEALPGMRDLAMDALVKEKEWGGRDEWYFSLLGDESLHELKVNGSTYTGLTTLMLNSSSDKYRSKMIELAGSDNLVIRTAAVKNLMLQLSGPNISDVDKEERVALVRALLPWMRDPNWVKLEPSGRSQIVQALGVVKLPESVPMLIEALDSKESRSVYASNVTLAMNIAANAVNTAAMAVANARITAANAVRNEDVDDDRSVSVTTSNTVASNSPMMANRALANASNTTSVPVEEYYPYRSASIAALGFQEDPRAAAPLRRVLYQVGQYERAYTVKALLAVQGFPVSEEVDAIEHIAKAAANVDLESADLYSNSQGMSPSQQQALLAVRTAIFEGSTSVSVETTEEDSADAEFDNYAGGGVEEPVEGDYSASSDYDPVGKPLDAAELKLILGSQLLSLEDPPDLLVRGMVDRIGYLDQKDPTLAATLRKIMIKWDGPALNALYLRDIRSGRMDANALVKLLSIRAKLRETQHADITELRTGTQSAIGIAACLLEDASESEAIMMRGSDEAKAALFACARLIRMPLKVDLAGVSLRSPNRLLAVAAERYLESEDSPAARSLILAKYPDQAKILGATTSFSVDGYSIRPGTYLHELFASVSPFYASTEYAYTAFARTSDFSAEEKRLRAEAMNKEGLLGIYAYNDNFVHIYADKAVFSWSDDPARYRERVMQPLEFEALKNYLAQNNVDSLTPFLKCSNECDERELLMIGKKGGRRVFVKADSEPPPFFAELDKIFKEMRERPAVLKYRIEEKLPGLTVVFSDENYSAKSVWAEGADIRVLVTDPQKEKAVTREIDRLTEKATDEATTTDDGNDLYQKFYKLREQRKFESFGWFGAANGKLGPPKPQPVHAPYIPAHDGRVPAEEFGSWRTKAAGVEYRTDDAGLYKVTAGRSVKIKTGSYSEAIVTANGRWLIASKYSDDDSGLFRINLLTNREYKIDTGQENIAYAVCYIPSVNRVLLTGYSEDEGEYEGEGTSISAYDTNAGYFFLNPDTGAITRSVGEVRPLAQQTFRSLQPTGTPGVFWAAMPRGTTGTLFGIYDSKIFTFKPLLKLPGIIFDSEEMWVDQPAGKLYFVHSGQLVSVPMPTAAPAVPR